MNRTTSIIASGIIFMLSASFIFKGDDTSNVEGKQYKISIMEAKKGGKSGSAEDDVCAFKGSKFKCGFFKKNAGAEGIPIELGKDSSYIDDGGSEEMIYAEFEGEMSNKLDETVKVTGTIDGYGIEGNVELSKKGKVKKHWDFVGTEKDKKKK
jgi:hypothetical protein